MRSLAWGGLLLGLAGCASTPLPPGGIVVAPPASSWTLQGRIGIQGGEQPLSGHIHWKHGPAADEVLMTSPLGQGVARIVRDARGVALEVPGQAVRHAPDADSLTREVLGYPLPVAGLAWWMQARPDPARAYEATHDASGRLARLRQDGWVIDYPQYTSDAPARPRKLVVTREGLEIRLVADRWEAE